MELLEWDAAAYDDLPLPHTRWGADVLDRLPVTEGAAVLELGCGTGRDSETLLTRAPSVSIVAVDGSEQMLERYRARIAEHAEREGRHLDVRTRHADLRQPLGLTDVADAAFSVATLHWLPDHQVVFDSVARALRPGGAFVADAGGAGNIASVRAALRELGADDGADYWNFADAETTAETLAASGFTDIEVEVVDDPARFETREQLEAYLAVAVLGAHLRELPREQHRSFIRGVADRLPAPVVDYCRLRFSARSA